MDELMGGTSEGFAEVSAYRRAAAALLAAYIAAMIVLPPLFGIGVDYRWLLKLYLLAAIPALTLPWIVWRKLTAIQPLVEATVITMMLMPAQLAVTFVAMRLNLPMVDQLLVTMDRALGFDWPAFVRMVDRISILSRLLAIAYASIFLQAVLAPAGLCALQRPQRAFRLVCCYGLLGLCASIIAAFFPSLSAYAGYGVDVTSLTNIDARNSWGFDHALQAVRNDPHFVLSERTASGIVNFPSVHAGLAMLLVWAAWPTKLRYPVLGLNTLMIVSALTHGAHYLVDVISGVVLAGAVVRLSNFVPAVVDSARGSDSNRAVHGTI